VGKEVARRKLQKPILEKWEGVSTIQVRKGPVQTHNYRTPFWKKKKVYLQLQNGSRGKMLAEDSIVEIELRKQAREELN